MSPTSVSIPPCPTPSLAAAGTAEATSMKKKTLQKRRTKIVGTLGPASIPRIKELILAGVNMFRLNFSHIENPETQTPIIEEIRKHSDELNIAVAILGDLCGPKIRCNDFKPGPTIQLTPGRPVRLVVSSGPGTDGVITTKIPEVVQQLENGHRILLDDGNLTLRVARRISDTELECDVLVGGELKSHKGINVPDIRLGVAALTDKDKRDAQYAYRMRLEYVAMSFVQRVEDVEELKRLFGEWKNSDAQLSANSRGSVRHHPIHDDIEAEVDELEENWRPHIILKIEKPQALDVIDDLIRVGDGIMVARGDMGVEISLERVPVIQKMLIRKANAADKPVITATQMLETMINSPVPTRAEVSDVANAVFDGTDAVMLSAECATGKYPVETVQMMARVCQQAEDGDTYMHPQVITARDRGNRVNDGSGEFAYPIADATVAAAEEANASAIIVFTTLGSMAIYVAKRRPNRPIIAVTSSYSLYRRLVLNYGVYPTLTPVLKIRSLLSKGPVSTKSLPPEADTSPTKTSPTGQSPTKSGTMLLVSNTDQIYAQAERDILKTAEELGLQKGDPVVFCAGFHAPWPGLSNTLRIARFGDAVRSAKARHLWGDVVSGVRAGHATSKQSSA